MNKKGDFATIVYVVIFLFVIGVVFLFMNKLNQSIFTELGNNLNETYGHTQAMTTLEHIKSRDLVVWDYAFLGIFFGCLMAIGLTAYAVRISPIFYWIYGIMSLTVLALGVILCNIWQEYAADPEFAAEILRFPIMNTILGTYYPLVATAIIILTMIFLFGKPPEGGEV